VRPYAALQVVQSKDLKEAAQLAHLQTALADKVNVLQGSVGVAGPSCLAPTLWQSAEELSDRLTIQETKPWTAQLDVVMASVESIWQQVVEANRGVEGIYIGRAGATIQTANKFLAMQNLVWKARLSQLAAASNPASPPCGQSATRPGRKCDAAGIEGQVVARSI
jgi:hypothetical protein